MFAAIADAVQARKEYKCFVVLSRAFLPTSKSEQMPVPQPWPANANVALPAMPQDPATIQDIGDAIMYSKAISTAHGKVTFN
jgi:hypothetical protein